MGFARFLFGLAIGSFINVIAVRYNPDRFILTKDTIGGRSHCSKCGQTLRWFELVPLLSYLVQRGRCRRCRAPLSLQYPLAELASGFVFLWVAPHAAHLFFAGRMSVVPLMLSVLWTAIFELLLLLSLIDIRLNLIPDEINILLAALGVAVIFVSRPFFGLASGSFFGPYALLFGGRGNIFMNHAIGFLVCAALFVFLILITRGRAMGIGDLKLAAALGIIFGWPDGFILCGLAFVAGSIFGGAAMAVKRKTMKSFLPFGPFLAFAALLTFFFGIPIVSAYFRLFPGAGLL